MFQEYALFPNMTTKKNIMAGMGKKPDQKKVADYIRRFHLEELEDHYPAELSGGQKQRVAMARMLAAEPELLLFDEPFAALDSYLKWELEQEMRDTLNEVKKPALFVSHNRDEVYRLCSMVGCIQEGKMEVVEPVKEFFHNPKTKMAAILSGCKNISNVKILDDTHLLATDWDVVLTLSDIPQDTTAIGIRAHFFVPEKEADSGENTFPIKEYKVIEDVFEWNISFKTSNHGSWLQWKIPKKEWVQDAGTMPKRLTIEEKDILLLTN